MEINTYGILDQNISPRQKQRYILTIVHEALHLISFNPKIDPKKLLSRSPEVIAAAPNLYAISNDYDVSNVLQNAHWVEAYIPNDIMTPVSRSNQILTIYTLEMIEQSFSELRAVPEHLVNNWFLDSIEDKRSFLTYKCKDDEISKYPTFCSAKQVSQEWSQCSGDYLFKTQCNNVKQDNNCYLNYSQEFGECQDDIPGRH